MKKCNYVWMVFDIQLMSIHSLLMSWIWQAHQARRRRMLTAEQLLQTDPFLLLQLHLQVTAHSHLHFQEHTTSLVNEDKHPKLGKWGNSTLIGKKTRRSDKDYRQDSTQDLLL